MASNGYIGFISANGFFIGIIFGILKFDTPESLLFATLVITAIFYMFAQISVSYFIRFIDLKGGNFPKKEYEMILDLVSKEIKKREDIYTQKPVKRKTKETVESDRGNQNMEAQNAA